MVSSRVLKNISERLSLASQMDAHDRKSSMMLQYLKLEERLSDILRKHVMKKINLLTLKNKFLF